MNTSFYTLIGVVAALWLGGIAACLLAFRWSFLANRRRFWPALALSMLALLISYLGLTRFRISAAQTENGRVTWHFDSRWFFIASLALSALALAYTLWKRFRSAANAV
jgi:hypothetical protein